MGQSEYKPKRIQHHADTGWDVYGYYPSAPTDTPDVLQDVTDSFKRDFKHLKDCASALAKFMLRP